VRVQRKTLVRVLREKCGVHLMAVSVDTLRGDKRLWSQISGRRLGSPLRVMVSWDTFLMVRSVVGHC
jgi:hypothetical protein